MDGFGCKGSMSKLINIGVYNRERLDITTHIVWGYKE